MKKTALVTGACINTGVAIVEKFLNAGYRVVFTGRSQEKVNEALAKYKSNCDDAEVYGYCIDSLIDDKTVDEESVKNLFADLDEKGIIVDCLVLNAANQGLSMKIFENPITDMQKVINTNVVWNYVFVQECAKRMINNGGGSIVFVNSNTAYRAIPDRIAYVTSKGAQLGMMRALALDLGEYNIRVNAVLPGMIKTDRWEKNPEFYANVPSRFTPIGDVAVGEDIADAVFYFAEYSRNTTGAELIVDGGNSIQLYPIISKA